MTCSPAGPTLFRGRAEKVIHADARLLKLDRAARRTAADLRKRVSSVASCWILLLPSISPPGASSTQLARLKYSPPARVTEPYPHAASTFASLRNRADSSGGVGFI